MTTKILLIEDDDSQRELVKSIFELEGFEVLCIPDSDKLLESIVDFKPQVVVTDIMLPNVDGFSLINIIHKNFPEIKILAYSAHVTPDKFKDFHSNAIKLGASEFIGKPYELEDFISKIRGLI